MGSPGLENDFYLNDNEVQICSAFQLLFLKILRHILLSPCTYTNNHLLQLAAWILNKDIEIHLTLNYLL